MRRSIYCVLVVTLAFSLVLVPGVYAQAVKDAQSGLYRIEGEVESVDKELSTITIRQHGKNIRWQILLTTDTSFSYMNKKGGLADVQEKSHVICLGDFDSKKAPNRMTAHRVEVRSPKI